MFGLNSEGPAAGFPNCLCRFCREWWVDPVTPGSPLGDAANLWAGPSAAGPWQLLFALRLRILHTFENDTAISGTQTSYLPGLVPPPLCPGGSWDDLGALKSAGKDALVSRLGLVLIPNRFRD